MKKISLLSWLAVISYLVSVVNMLGSLPDRSTHGILSAIYWVLVAILFIQVDRRETF